MRNDLLWDIFLAGHFDESKKFSAYMNWLQSFDEDTLFCCALQFLKTKSKFWNGKLQFKVNTKIWLHKTLLIFMLRSAV